jgi:hypothetical protein
LIAREKLVAIVEISLCVFVCNCPSIQLWTSQSLLWSPSLLRQRPCAWPWSLIVVAVLLQMSTELVQVPRCPAVPGCEFCSIPSGRANAYGATAQMVGKSTQAENIMMSGTIASTVQSFFCTLLGLLESAKGMSPRIQSSDLLWRTVLLFV